MRELVNLRILRLRDMVVDLDQVVACYHAPFGEGRDEVIMYFRGGHRCSVIIETLEVLHVLSAVETYMLSVL